VINMASERAALPVSDDNVLRTAPDHIVDMILSLMRPAADPTDIGRARARRAEARAWADRIWAEAAHAGATWGLERAPTKMLVSVVPDLPALGDLIRKNEPE
jgi:hypothetical protein